MRIDLRAESLRSRLHARPAKTTAIVNWSILPSPLGKLLVAVTAKGVCAVEFERLNAKIHKQRRLSPRAKSNSRILAHAIAQLREYFAGNRNYFDLPLDLASLTPFQREVLAVTKHIPQGEVWSYQGVAERMGRAKSSRPVGQALGRNPIPIIIPCHRVIASDGTLGGYCGTAGLNIKRWLLRHEGVRL